MIRRLLIGSASLLALVAAADPALAQTPDTPPTNTPPSGSAEPAPSDTGEPPAGEEEIVVTGIRGSVRASIQAKRDSSVVADMLTAEDIG